MSTSPIVQDAFLLGVLIGFTAGCWALLTNLVKWRVADGFVVPTLLAAVGLLAMSVWLGVDLVLRLVL